MLFGKHVNRYYLKYSYIYFIGLIALVLVDYFQLKIPELYKTVVNGMNGDIGSEFDLDFLLDKICMPLIVIIVSLIIGRFVWRMCFFGTAIQIEADIRQRMFDKCETLSQQFYHVNKVGNLMSLFTNDLETVQECFSMGVLMMCDALFLGGLALIKMFRLNSVLTLFSLVPMIFLFLIGLFIGSDMKRKWRKRLSSFADMSDFVQENFSGISVIKAFVKEHREIQEFGVYNQKIENANVSFTKAVSKLNVFVTLFVESVICVILAYGGYLAHGGSFNAGELVEFIGYFNAIVWPINAVSSLIELRSRGKASLIRIGELLDATPDVVDADDVEDCGELKGDIEFRNLTFRYPDGATDALRNVSFKIKAGESVGIIGKTGCGKTTVVDLILRTYNVPDGTLFLDGTDVNRIPIQTTRKYISYVPQDNFLFSDTIEHNITFSTDKRAMDVIHAAKLADVHGNIAEFRHGYNTVLGERGVTVSGGQKQRISIARSLIKDAPILILDDAVSAVDVSTEKTILKNLHETRKGKTTILIAHRVSTIENLDKIIYIDDGEIAAVGTHAQLCETSASYRHMVELQEMKRESEGIINA